MTTYTKDQMLSIGGSTWTNPSTGKTRIYFNTDIWTKLIGLEVSHYNSGNISGATLDGEDLSNARARDILATPGKIYWDETDGQVHMTVNFTRYRDRVPGWIRDGIADAVQALTKEQ